MRVIVRKSPRPSTQVLLGGIGIGAALMYYLDSTRGAQRRGQLRDRLAHAADLARETVGTTSRNLANRARGVAAQARALGEGDEADDRLLEARVRAELGRVISHPRSIDVMADQGRVTLAGDVLLSQAHRLIRRVTRVRGVTEVNNRLRVSDGSEGVPSLEDGAPRTGDEVELPQDNWGPAARFLTSVAGGAMALYGVARRDRFGSAMGIAGLALLTRGVANRDPRAAVGARGRNGIAIHKTVSIDASPEEVFAFLTDWENFPHWMSHVRAVRSSGPRGEVGERTHWEVDGPAGSSVEWDAVTTRFVPNELVAWKSVEGEPIRQAGKIRFAPTPESGTRVHVELQYNPPGGALGHAIAALFKRDPKHQMDDDLTRLKTAIETGKAPSDAAAPTSQSAESIAAESPAESPGGSPAEQSDRPAASATRRRGTRAGRQNGAE